MYNQFADQNPTNSGPEIQQETHRNDVKEGANAPQFQVQKSVMKIAKVEPKKFDSGALKKLESALKTAPVPAPKLTKNETILALLSELKTQVDRGHTPGSLAAILETGGLKISQRKLAQLLRQNA